VTPATGFPLVKDDVEHLWSELISVVSDNENSHAAAMIVRDPDTLKQTWHYDKDVEVGVWLRPRESGTDRAAYYAKLPLLELWKRLERFEILEIGASTFPNRPIFLGAVTCEHYAGSTYASVVADWRGVGRMAASRKFGDVFVSVSERSGVPEVNARRELALALLEREYGPKASDIARQSSIVTILEQFAASKCFAWFIYRMSPDPTMLARGPVRGDERRLAEVIASEVDKELSLFAFGATRPQYEKARQWRIHYDDQSEDDDDEYRERRIGLVGPSQARINLTRGVGALDAPADVLGLALADDDLLPSQLHALHDSGFSWPELLRHAIAFRDKRGLTPREAKFLNLFQAGFYRHEIAAREGWSEATVSRDLIRAGYKVRKYNLQSVTEL
jgi:hypothetical protein